MLVVSEQGSSFPFGKWTCYDTGLQSACLARWPDQIKPGTVSAAMIEYVSPTFIEAAGGTPPPLLDGKSFVSVLRGETDRHKSHVYGIMTTRGIINGSDHFGIRSVRDKQFKYIRNLTPEVPFRNACMRSPAFRSWEKKAAGGDEDAADKVHRYRHRPAEELYEIGDDWYEWRNLASDPQYADVKTGLSDKLDRWMKSQGDKGAATELEALEHQRRNRNKAKKKAG